eukprot:5691225-Pyramimonas_sp.AAC.1
MARIVSGRQHRGARTDIWWQVHEVADPLSLASSSLERYCTEWWRATSGRAEFGMHAGGLDAKELRTLFVAVRTKVQDPWNTSWLGRSAGPISDMLLWLQRAGWHFDNPTTLQPRVGGGIDIREIPPVSIAKQFTEGLKEQQSRQAVGIELGALPFPPPPPVGQEGGVDWVQ